MAPCSDYAHSNTKRTDEALNLLFLLQVGFQAVGIKVGNVQSNGWISRVVLLEEQP